MGVPPSPATKALLEQGLNVVGRVVKTSKYKFADWNIKLPKGTTKLPDAEFKKLSRAATFFREGYFTTQDIKKIQTEARLAKEAQKAAKEATKLAKESTKLAKESKKLLDKTKKVAEDSKKVIDTVLKKVPGANTAAKALGASNMLGALAIMGAQAGITAFAAWVSNFVQDTQDKNNNLISEDLTKLNGRALANTALIRKQQEQINKAELENQKVRDRIYGLEKQQPAIRDSIADAKKKSNDALYETRAGRTKLEAEIADAKKKSNDALYETRAGRTKLEDKIANVQSQINKFTQGATSNFQSKIEVTIGIIQGRLNTTENKITNLEKAKPTLQDKVIQTIQDSVKKVSVDLAPALTKLAQLEKVPAQVQSLQSQIKTIETEHPKRWGITVTQAEVRQATITKSTDSATRTYVERKLAQVTESQFSATEWVGRYGAKTADLVTSGVDRLYKNDEVLSGGIAAVATNVDQRIAKLEQQGLQVSDPAVGGLIKSVNNLRTDLEQVKVNEKKIGADIGALTTKIKEQEKVNQQAIPKLDQILGLIPLIPARAAAAIRPDIPTIPQIETASATGTCRTLQPGGCGAKALNDLGSGVNQNTNNQSNNLFDKLNAGANAAQLALLKIIDNKLGKQITGGISGKLVDGFKWLQLDRVLGVLTFAATVQNHLMLSNDIGQTLIGAFTNVLNFLGLKDDQGKNF
ncbi:hypothetical protein [[Scytonema hofmanni] UTEX B 1581]|uniref:hypothetical protein n=1 Tax=[Scytonema hofmanni] UTEX B 1581 TaxID=379535 RepID=UPI000497F580|nr:hypothetical protein [[Scytonema hofmanni] UTEX B 1581]